MNSPEIVHVNTHDVAGGAAKVAWRLAVAQRAQGRDARILARYAREDSGFSASFDPAENPDLVDRCRREGLLYHEYQGSHSLAEHPFVRDCRVVHLHNLHGGYFNPFSLIPLSLAKPVVWTLHDMQALTGRCAHAFDCRQWRSQCGECPGKDTYPQIEGGSEALLLARKALVARLSRVHLAVPSAWLGSMVRESVLGGVPVRLIPNFCDASTFSPRDKVLARRRLGLPEDALLVGASAHGGPLENSWKGGGYTRQAVEILTNNIPNAYFVNIGGSRQGLHERVLTVPHQEDEADLAWALSALDLFLYTPVADNCPLVVIEALCCGLPVVSFGVGGIAELVRHGLDGLVVPFGDVEALTRAASRLLADREERGAFSLRARQSGLERFDVPVALAAYQSLYDSAVLEHQARASDPVRICLGELPQEILTPPFLQALRHVQALGRARVEP